MAVIGYARTSTADQVAGLDDQIAALKREGCERIWSEQVSSVDVSRPELAAALDYLREGDVFIVTKPDRLARSVATMLELIDRLTRKGVRVRILSLNVDTAEPTGKLILVVMAGIAEWERAIMLERQRAGIAKAKADGKYRGRTPTARARAEQMAAMKAEGLGESEIALALGVHRSSVYRTLAWAEAREPSGSATG